MAEMMRAMVIRQTGGPEVFETAEVPVPMPTGHQVLVKIAATSVNPIDCKVRSGAVALLPPYPAILHGDLSGTVAACGPEATRFREGDAVFGFVGWTGGEGGALAEYAVCDERLLARAPKSLPLEQAAVLPVGALTAYGALQRKVQIRPGDLVLVHGGAGGVGHYGIQLAKAFGASVAATVGSEEHEAVARTCGADWVIRHDLLSVTEYVQAIAGGRGFDIVFDTAGGANLARSFEAARPGGSIVTSAARVTMDLTPMHAKGLNLLVVFLLLPVLTGEGREDLGKDLEMLAAMVDEGRLRPVVFPRSFTLDEIADAHRLLESGRHYGKILVSMS